MSNLTQLDEIFAKHPDIVLGNIDDPTHMMVRAQITALKRQGVDLKARYSPHRPKIIKNPVTEVVITDDNSDPGDEVPEPKIDIVTKKTKKTSQKP